MGSGGVQSRRANRPLRLKCADLRCLRGSWFWALVPQAQISPEEEKGLSDALFLNNLSLSDLNFFRRPISEQLGTSFLHSSLDKPLEGANTLIALHRKACSSLPSEVLAMARKDILASADIPGPSAPKADEAKIPASVPQSVRAYVADYAEAVAAANESVGEALHNITREEKRLLIDSLPGLAAEQPDLKFDFTKSRPASMRTALALLQRVDIAGMEAAAQRLSVAVEQDLPGLRKAAQSITWDGRTRFELAGIQVVVDGMGNDDHHDVGAQLVIDLGGANRYTWREGAGILGASLLINLGDNAVFDQQDLGAGCGVLGIGLAYDIGQHSLFSGGNLGLGAGLAGVGVLYAEGEGNVFQARALSEGFGMFGIGALIGDGESDRFSGKIWAQGAARTQGVGWLIDRKGNTVLQLAGMGSQNLSCGQAYSAGYNDGDVELGGGAGLVTLGFGKTTLVGEVDCQACARDFGLASLFQLDGDHDYVATADAQAYAEGQSCAYLFSMRGDGTFNMRSGAGQSSGVGDSVAFLVDRNGENDYNGPQGPGQGIDRGLAVFLHDVGKERLAGASA